jgi:DSF synthase
MQVRQKVNPVSREELDGIVDIWVDCAMRLEDRDLRMMSRVVGAQMDRMGTASGQGAQYPVERRAVAN